jgi:thioredoxin:protein disulfide reductase
VNHATIFVMLCSLLISSNATAQGLLDRISGSDSPFNLGADQPEFLDPEIAFRFSSQQQHGVVRLAWDIAPGYYLYRDRFKLAVENPRLTPLFENMPAGEMKEDPEFGRVEIYRNQLILHAKLELAEGLSSQDVSNNVDLSVTYQGCAEDGICYPPIKKTVNVSLNDAVKQAAAPTSINPNVANNVERSLAAPAISAPSVLSADKLEAQLAGRGVLSTMIIFFGFGLLLSFTPCVFPMVPILSGIIVGQKQPVSTARAFRLSASYVLAMALTYALVGVIAGIFGHNLQATFQQPQWIIGFSVVFVLLALSMFGFYNLELPQSWQTKLDQISRSQSGGSYLGVAVMGVLSAIIVGPCVAPPFAAALLYLSHQGSPLIGGAALFAMALGMGALLLVVGTASGQLVPRSGAWMENVKRFFGVVLLGVAIWFLGRVLPGTLIMMLWAALFVITAVYLGALEAIQPSTQASTEAHELSSWQATGLSSGWAFFKKGVGLIALVYGFVLIVGASAGGNDPLNPLAPLVNRTPYEVSELSFITIKSVEDLERAVEKAAQNNQLTMLDFYADWCIECKHLEKNTFANAAVQQALGEVLLLRADVTANDEVDQALLKRFELFGPPAVLFFAPDGLEKRSHRVVGFLGAEQFLNHLQALKRS